MAPETKTFFVAEDLWYSYVFGGVAGGDFHGFLNSMLKNPPTMANHTLIVKYRGFGYIGEFGSIYDVEIALMTLEVVFNPSSRLDLFIPTWLAVKMYHIVLNLYLASNEFNSAND